MLQTHYTTNNNSFESNNVTASATSVASEKRDDIEDTDSYYSSPKQGVPDSWADLVEREEPRQKRKFKVVIPPLGRGSSLFPYESFCMRHMRESFYHGNHLL